MKVLISTTKNLTDGSKTFER